MGRKQLQRRAWGRRGIAEVSVRVKVLLDKTVDWVPANSGLTNHLQLGCRYHLGFALGCVKKKGFKKGKTSHFHKAETLLLSRA